MSLKSASEYKDLQLRMNSKVQAVLKGGTAAREYEYENSTQCLLAPALNLRTNPDDLRSHERLFFVYDTVGRTAPLEMKGAKMRRERGRGWLLGFIPTGWIGVEDSSSLSGL